MSAKNRSVQLPHIEASVTDMDASVRRVHAAALSDPDLSEKVAPVLGPITYEIDQSKDDIIRSWAPLYDCERADDLGFRIEKDLDKVVVQYIEDFM